MSEPKPRVALISIDTVGPKMAGPGIRYWEMARYLTNFCQVTLFTPQSTTIAMDNVASRLTVELVKDPSLFDDFDVVIGQGLDQFVTVLMNKKIRVVVDLYAPLTVEGLDYLPHDRAGHLIYQQYVLQTKVLLLMADYILCASPQQRNLYVGMLVMLGRISPDVYRRDRRLQQMIGVVPFGLPNNEPHKTRPVLKGVVPGIEPDSQVILWGGGIWNWFDPLTVIEAVALVAKKKPNIRLYFLGIAHPNPEAPATAMVGRAVQLAEEQKIRDKLVFFHDDWVDYDDRQNYLLESDLSVVFTPPGLENDFSYRTRVLDCIWAQVPVVLNGGSVLADEVKNLGMGIVVNEYSVEALAAAILDALDSKSAAIFRKNIEKVRSRYDWDKAFAPLGGYISHDVIVYRRPLGRLRRLKNKLQLNRLRQRYIRR